jgi:hypothetical protein
MAGARRYTKWTPEHTQKVCEALRAGNTRRAACIYAGVSEDSLARWLQKAEVADAIQKADRVDPDAAEAAPGAAEGPE